MPDRRFKRPAHQQVLSLLGNLDSAFLAEARCYFGGGTRIVLELGEYRVSRDMCFLCSDRDGYRLLRETVLDSTLGKIAATNLTLVRDVRADQYGVRTFIEQDDTRLKFEIAREARIDLSGTNVSGLPVTCLARPHCFAERFLANADRGMDASTLSRDIIDLAFMVEGWSADDARLGMELAVDAYGDSTQKALDSVLIKMKENRTYRNRCVEGLAIKDTRVMNAGLKTLRKLIS